MDPWRRVLNVMLGIILDSQPDALARSKVHDLLSGKIEAQDRVTGKTKDERVRSRLAILERRKKQAEARGQVDG